MMIVDLLTSSCKENHAAALYLLASVYDRFPHSTLVLGQDRVEKKRYWAVYDLCKGIEEPIALHEDPHKAVELAISKLANS